MHMTAMKFSICVAYDLAMTTRSLLALMMMLTLTSCPTPRSSRALVLATTTSIDNSGLLRSLSQAVEQQRKIAIRPLVVGTGKALALAARGDVSVTLTHNETAEREFVSKHGAALYRQFMTNEFVIVGPPDDPAHVAQATSATDAFRRLHTSRSPFAARNDDSGTAMREVSIWKAAELDPRANPAYRPLGQPMAALLRSANELRAYTLTDTATFSNLEPSLQLKILYRGDPLLRNTYAIIVTRSDDPIAREFAEWLLSADGRSAVESFRIRGAQQFHWLEPRDRQ